MRWIFISLLITFVTSSLAATESNTFEQRFQKLGKKLDQAKAKGEKIGQEAKQELQELKALSEDAGAKALEESSEARKDWKKRFSAALSELGVGMKNAWQKLKGDE